LDRVGARRCVECREERRRNAERSALSALTDPTIGMFPSGVLSGRSIGFGAAALVASLAYSRRSARTPQPTHTARWPRGGSGPVFDRGARIGKGLRSVRRNGSSGSDRDSLFATLRAWANTLASVPSDCGAVCAVAAVMPLGVPLWRRAGIEVGPSLGSGPSWRAGHRVEGRPSRGR
jgi:hypothetical protein